MSDSADSGETTADWHMTAAVPALADDAVHVWRADVASMRARVAELAAVLDVTERARASAFHFAIDAERYVIAHGLLRHLLGRYVGARASEIVFTFGEFGKPALSVDRRFPPVTFNMSHTHDVVVFAFAARRELGVDVERWSEDVDCLALAPHVFSAREIATLRALPARQHRSAFFAAWSRKEAYIKATGFGVSRGLDHFDVTLDPAESATLLVDRSDASAVLRWRLCDLGFAPGHSGAIVAEGHDWELRRFALPESFV